MKCKNGEIDIVPMATKKTGIIFAKWFSNISLTRMSWMSLKCVKLF
jgi:hypothetical protein